MRWLIAGTLLVACACPSKQAGTATTGSGGGGAGSGSATPAATGCDAVTAKIEGLYRTEATGAEKGATKPEAVEVMVADNTAMVMAECRRAPDQVAACIAGVTSVKDLEAQCMPKLDEEGTEADVLVH